MTAFLDFMNNISIEKYAWDETTGAYVPRSIYVVPVQFSSSDKMFAINTSTSAMKTFPPENSLSPVEMAITVPRIAVNLVGLVYDNDRKVNKLNRMQVNQGEGSLYMGVPYNLEFEVTSITKSLDDTFQIMEQIIPFFTPAMSLDVNTYLDMIESIPVSMTSLSFDFPQDVAEADERLYQVSYFFTMRAHYYMQKRDRSVIEHITANLSNSVIQIDAV